jgi:hypothetical protein
MAQKSRDSMLLIGARVRDCKMRRMEMSVRRFGAQPHRKKFALSLLPLAHADLALATVVILLRVVIVVVVDRPIKIFHRRRGVIVVSSIVKKIVTAKAKSKAAPSNGKRNAKTQAKNI